MVRALRHRLPAWLLAAAVVLMLPGVRGQTTNSGPRGKPIRPPASRLTNAPQATIVTLPGGVVITNLPPELLPQSTNVVRLPTRAARKFEPLGFQSTSFTVLARFFPKPPPPDPTRPVAELWEEMRRQIPEDVLALNGRKVALAGFILPISLVDGRTQEFLLLRTQSACCFGMVPRVNELVIVKAPAPGIKPVPDTPFVVGGTFGVRWIGEAGQLTALYEMQAEKVERAEGF